jgi:hypothetical protein
LTGAGTRAAAQVQDAIQHCPICASDMRLERLQASGKVCRACGATRQSVDLASAVLFTLGRGVSPSLAELVFEERTRAARILDLSGDGALASVMWALDHYRAALPADAPAGEGHGAEPAQLVVLRDVLFCAGDLDASLESIGRRVASGGWVVIQEYFAWPIPETTAAATGSRPTASGTRATVRFDIGADIVDRFRVLGFLAEFYRPGSAIDPLYRNAVLVAQRI